MKKSIAVVGYGYVGKAVTNFFKDHFRVIVRDKTKEFYFEEGQRSKERIVTNEDWSGLQSADLAVICVPTPMGEDGAVDLSIVEDVLMRIPTPLVLIKSTIPPGTTDSLKEKTKKRIVFSPEYIGEGNYVVQWWKDKSYPHPTDMKKHDFQIFGGDRADALAVLQYFKEVMGPEPQYILTRAATAELCKYMENAFFATKVTFCNEFFNIAKKFDVDYDELRELWLLDGRVSRMHTNVFEHKRGFGGKCLPKDLSGIVSASCKAGYSPDFLKHVIVNNSKFRQ